MATFAQQILAVQIKAVETSKMELKVKSDKRKDELFDFLTKKYHAKIKRSIMSAAQRGSKEKFMNFEKDDFKANCEGLGFPKDVQRLWLKEVILNKDEDTYLPIDEMTGMRDHLHGINFEVWNNAKFTTRFYW
jgi:hypothetical protein